MEAIKLMLMTKIFSVHLWVEEERKTIYVQNLTPHRVLDNKTPEESFSRKKPEFNHLRIFGCLMYIHIPKEKRTKLDISRRKGIFVGYNDTSKAYRIYFPGFKKIKISRAVTFDEDSTFSRSGRVPIEEVEELEGTRV